MAAGGAHRRYLVMVRNASGVFPDLPAGAWGLVDTPSSESAARARYFELRDLLDALDAGCLVIEATRQPFGRDDFRTIITRGVAPGGPLPDPVRLSREQQLAFEAAVVAGKPSRPVAHPRPRPSKISSNAVWGSVLAVSLLLLGILTFSGLGSGGRPAETAASADRSSDGSVIILPEGEKGDRFVMFRLLPDGSRTDLRHLSKAELEALQARSGVREVRTEPRAASRTSSLAERASMFARLRSSD